MGTTWIARALGEAQGTLLVHEPDNEGPIPFALKAKLALGRFPVLAEGERAPRVYEQLWARAFRGFRQDRLTWRLVQLMKNERRDSDLWRAMCDHANPWVSPRLRVMASLAVPPWRREPADVVIVKSVYASLALEWVASRFRPLVVVSLRHPLNVISSWAEIGWGGCALDTHPKIHDRFGPRFRLPQLGPGSSSLDRVAWEVGLFTSVLHAVAEDHQDWIVVSHEDLCADPAGRFRRLYEQIGLTWTDSTDRFLEGSNRPGTGYSLDRVAADQPERWRKRLSPDQLREIWAVLSRFRAPWVERVARELE
jgi:hypothetical protein